MNEPIQPEWTCYTLDVEPTTTGAPAHPAVRLTQREVFGDEWIRDYTLTPQQARDLAAMLATAADQAGSAKAATA